YCGKRTRQDATFEIETRPVVFSHGWPCRRMLSKIRRLPGLARLPAASRVIGVDMAAPAPTLGTANDLDTPTIWPSWSRTQSQECRSRRPFHRRARSPATSAVTEQAVWRKPC